MTNKQLAKQLRDIGNSLFDRTNDPNFKLFLDEASDRLENQSKWISVDEKLPSKREWVICYSPNKKSFSIFLGYMGNYSSCWLQDGGCICMTPVTHWMPLPEAPKKKGGAEE